MRLEGQMTAFFVLNLLLQLLNALRAYLFELVHALEKILVILGSSYAQFAFQAGTP